MKISSDSYQYIQDLRKEETIHILFAGCSTGQESFSAAMLIDEMFDPDHIELTGIDISDIALDRAKTASYKMSEIQRGISQKYLNSYFFQKDGLWLLDTKIKNMVHFYKKNIVNPGNWYMKFDIFFFRNVLIYFDVETKKKALKNVYKLLKNKGYLILGNGEMAHNLESRFSPIIYKKEVIFQKE